MLLLHRAEADLVRSSSARFSSSCAETDPTLAGKKVLVVDDDVRNIFALTSVLEAAQPEGGARRERPRRHRDCCRRRRTSTCVLMDIMMPEMDGYETMRAIRQIPEFRSLPIIALTAKAMKGDRAKCIEAGASDYITKPVDLDQLFSVLRVWLVRGQESRRQPAS